MKPRPETQDDQLLLLSTSPPTRTQWRLAVCVLGVLIGALLVTAPFASIPLPDTEVLLPAYAAARAAGRVGSGLTFHGLRHTVGALLKEDGWSDEDIAIALGQKTVAMARHYSSGADKRKRMTAAIAEFDPLKRNRPGT